MLKFDENQRPSFTELSKLVLTADNSVESPRNNRKSIQSGKQTDPRKVNKQYSMKEFTKGELSMSDGPHSKLQKNDFSVSNKLEDSQSNLMTQSELFKSYCE